MIKPLLIIFTLIFSFKNVHADTLRCNFDDYSRTSTKISVVKSWIPVNQTHYISGNSISFSQKGLTGKITQNDSKKIKWNIETTRSMKNKGQVRINFVYIFFKTNNKAVAEVRWPGFRDIEGVWGKCTYNKTTSNASTTTSNSSSSNTYRIIDGGTDEAICNMATDGYPKSWRTAEFAKEYVLEAKRRSLSCGVSSTAFSNSSTASSNLENYSDWEVCDEVKNSISWVQEAKRRGLNCGVNDGEAQKKRIAEEKAQKEKERQAELKKQERIKAEQEKIKKKAEEVALKKRLEEEKIRKQKLAAEKVMNKQLAEEERKRKLAQDKLNKQITNYKRKASNFYKDIENFVKSGGNVDLVKLSDFFDIKPNSKDKWNKTDLSRYEQLREFMTSIPEFVSYEKERIGKRLKNSFAMKDQSIEDLENNLSELKGLMRKMFGSNEVPKIREIIKDIQSTLSNFNQLVANKVLNKSTSYIASQSPQPKVEKRTTKVASSSDTSWTKLKSDLTIQQQQFCQLTDRFYNNLNIARKSKNEIKVNMVHKERQENLDALIPQGNINNWIFKVIKIDQVEDGSAAVVLGLQCKSYVGSGQTIDIKRGMSRKDKKEWRATIPYDDRRFRELAKLDQGQFIVGSGTMLEINAYKPGQKETFYASQQIGEHPLTKGLNLEGELFITDLSYIAALN